jgi:hypothetical protein
VQQAHFRRFPQPGEAKGERGIVAMASIQNELGLRCPGQDLLHRPARAYQVQALWGRADVESWARHPQQEDVCLQFS